MNKTEYIAFAEAEMNRVLAIVRKKNSDYTGGTECTDPFANFTISTDFGVPPLTGLCIRMADKFQRVKTFCRDGKMAQSNEGAVDAFRDIIGYSLIALGMLEEQRELYDPPEEKPVWTEEDWAKYNALFNGYIVPSVPNEFDLVEVVSEPQEDA
jgi:hypothetical protein